MSMEWPTLATMCFALGSVFGGLAIMLSLALSKRYLPQDCPDETDSTH